MSALDRLLRRAAGLTEPRPGAVDRLQARQAFPARALRESAAEPAEGATDRLLARVEAPRRRRRAWLLVPAVAGALATVALWPAPAPRHLQGRLDAEARVEAVITSSVQLGYVGHGELGGTTEAVRIFWEVGTLEVEVAPGAGVQLEVETSEGRVAVLGTRFSVTRGPLGTEVAVERGAVRVACGQEASQALVEPGRALCLPLRPAGMLGRARALQASGAPPEDVLAAIDRGLALAAPGSPALGELVALRLDVLVSTGRYAEARAAAEAYLRSGDLTRRDEVEAILRELGTDR